MQTPTITLDELQEAVNKETPRAIDSHGRIRIVSDGNYDPNDKSVVLVKRKAFY
jgi:hypothetical protein